MLTRTLTHTAIIYTRFEVDMTIHCWVIAFLLIIRYVTWPLTFWPWTVVILTKPATKLEDLWFITSSIRHQWKCVHGHCACAESRDPWVGGQKQLHFCNPPPRFAYLLYNFYWATATIKGRSLSSCPMFKPFSDEKIVPSKWGPKITVFGESRGVNVKLCVRGPQKARPCAEPRLVTFFTSKSVRASWL